MRWRTVLLTTGLVLGLSSAPANAADDPVIVDSTKHGGRTVAFTFDDGPNPADTPRLLDVLRRHHVKAVFCLWGDYVEANPGLVRKIVAGGHTLCNHSMHHDNMGEWTPEQIRAAARDVFRVDNRLVLTYLPEVPPADDVALSPEDPQDDEEEDRP